MFHSFNSNCSLVLLVSVAAFASTACSDVTEDELSQTGVVAPNNATPVRTSSADPEGFAKARRDPNYIRTPVGLVHRDCIVEVPSGTVVAEDGLATRPDGTQVALERCDSPTYVDSASGQEVAAPSADKALAEEALTTSAPSAISGDRTGVNSGWTSSRWLSSLVENVTVPSNPAKSGAILNFYPALSASRGTGILKPILEWGPRGNTWSMAVYYVWGGGNLLMTQSSSNVKAGDSLWAGIQSSKCRSDGTRCTWSITMRNRRTAEITNLQVVSYDKYDTVYGGALDVFNATACSQLPANGSIAFSGLQVFDGNNQRVSPDFSVLSGLACAFHGTANPSSTKLTWSTR